MTKEITINNLQFTFYAKRKWVATLHSYFRIPHYYVSNNGL